MKMILRPREYSSISYPNFGHYTSLFFLSTNTKLFIRPSGRYEKFCVMQVQPQFFFGSRVFEFLAKFRIQFFEPQNTSNSILTFGQKTTLRTCITNNYSLPLYYTLQRNGKGERGESFSCFSYAIYFHPCTQAQRLDKIVGIDNLILSLTRGLIIVFDPLLVVPSCYRNIIFSFCLGSRVETYNHYS